jgi:site-specific recombinase XerD
MGEPSMHFLTTDVGTEELSSHPSMPFLRQEVERFLEHALSENTWKAYRTDWRLFELWCAERDLMSLPAQAETVAGYIAHLASVEGCKAATIERKLSSISVRHGTRGLESPTKTVLARETLRGTRNTIGAAQTKKKPIVTDELARIIATCEALHPLAAARDRALLLIGFAGAMRRSEIAALTLEDVTEVLEGLDVLIRRSKTDQAGRGRTVSIAYGSHLETCPVRTLRAWLALSGVSSGPLFREVDRHGNLGDDCLHPASVARIVKRACQLAGYDVVTHGGTRCAQGSPPRPPHAGAASGASSSRAGGRVMPPSPATSASPRGGTTTHPPTWDCSCGLG